MRAEARGPHSTQMTHLYHARPTFVAAQDEAAWPSCLESDSYQVYSLRAKLDLAYNHWEE
jgi:hypothetical protein